MSELPSYEIVKYSDQQIIMKNQITRELFTFINHGVPEFEPIDHPSIQTPIVFENGLLYPLPLTTMSKQIDLIRKNEQASFE